MVIAGSANVDPRSFNLNTEMWRVIRSQSLADGILSRFDTVAPDYAFEVRLVPRVNMTSH